MSEPTVYPDEATSSPREREQKQHTRTQVQPQVTDSDTIPDAFSAADTALLQAQTQVDVYDHTTPVNWRQERERFLRHDSTPAFAYHVPRRVVDNAERLRARLVEVQEQVARVDVTGESLQYLQDRYLDAISDAIRYIDIVLDLGNRDRVVEASQQVWGTPRRRVLDFAEQILSGEAPLLTELVPRERAPCTTPSKTLAAAFTDLFDTFGLTDWTVTHTDGITHVNPVKKHVYVSYGDEQGRINAWKERLLLHEFGVHVLRAANGWNQPYSIFRTGFNNYETTEEGLTAYVEYNTGHMTKELAQMYALRVIATQRVLDGACFQETFDDLHAYNIPAREAFYTAMRAHRGGGFIKDHIYLQGFHQLRDHLSETEGTGDINALYMGKIPLEDLDHATKLQHDGHLRPAQYTLEQVIDTLLPAYRHL